MQDQIIWFTSMFEDSSNFEIIPIECSIAYVYITTTRRTGTQYFVINKVTDFL